MFWQTIGGIAIVVLTTVIAAALGTIIVAFTQPIFGNWAVAVAATVVIALAVVVANWVFNRKPEPSGYH